MIQQTTAIGIDYTAAAHQSAGIGRLVRELTRALAEQHPEQDVRLFVAGARACDLPPYPGRFEYRTSRLSERNHTRLWHRLRLPLPVELWTGDIDLFHATDFTLPPTRRKTRTVLTIPDLSYERYPSETMPGMLKYLQTVVPRSIERADHVIAISETTRADLVDLYGVPPEKVSAIPLGVDPRFSTGRTPEQVRHLREKYRLPEGPFVLTVGTMQPRKNHRRLIEAFYRLPESLRMAFTLVIAGGKGWGYDEVEEYVKQLGPDRRVVFTGFVDDGDLPALYRAATVFAYPALYEGFGLPVLEAMASGVPVLTSNISSLPEVTGPVAATLVDPLSVESIMGGLELLLDNPDLRARLGELGVERAATFTWAHTADEVWAVYDRLLG